METKEYCLCNSYWLDIEERPHINCHMGDKCPNCGYYVWILNKNQYNSWTNKVVELLLLSDESIQKQFKDKLKRG